MITAEEFFRNKIKEQNPNIEIVNLSQELITAEQGMRWAHEFKQLHKTNVSSELNCDHEWLNHSFDHFGFLQEQICDKCGAKRSVP